MKALVAAAILSLAAINSWAQGTIIFQNGGLTFSPVANRYVYACRGPIGPGDATDAAWRLVGTNYCAGLWYVPGAGNGGDKYYMNGFTAFLSLSICPEPSTIVLGALCMTGLLLWRRPRK